MVTNLAMALEPIEISISEISEAPIKWCSVSLSEIIAKGTRLEASVFDVEAKHAWELLQKSKYATVPIGGSNGLASSYTGARFKRIWVEKSEFPIFQPSSITNSKPSPDGYISERTQTNIDALRVRKNQILLTCSGTIGKVSYVSKTLENAIFSHDLLRITCKIPEDAGYIYTYLKSKIGKQILLTNSYGSVITHIEPEHLATDPIPNAPPEIKKKIHDLIVKSYDLRDESNELIDQAAALLVDKLKLPPIQELMRKVTQENASVETFSVKLSEMEGRIDASYHVPVVGAIIRHLKEHAKEVTCVGDKRISKYVILPGRFKRTYVNQEDGKVFIGGKQLHELDPWGKKYLSLSKHTTRIEKELEIEENTILVTRSGTIGKVAIVPKHWQHWVVSEHVIRIVPTSKDVAGYLSIFLSSEYGYELIKRFTYGSVVDEIDDAHVKQIPIPLLSDQVIQKKINDLALEANAKRYEAYQLEQQALQIMDHDVIYAK